MRLVRHYMKVTLVYLALTAVSFVIYHFLQRLPEANGVISAMDLLKVKGSPLDGLAKVWFIFAWGFGLQSLVQVSRIFRRHPRDGDLTQLVHHGAYISAHAGLFEEIIFRLYAFLSFIIALRFLDNHLGHVLESTSTHVLLPALNFVTVGIFRPQLLGPDWALGIALVLGSLFFRSAHIHYGKLSKANVWVIGLVMFWLMFHYGLLTAILAHFLYDLSVFMAIALTAPLQPHRSRK